MFLLHIEINMRPKWNLLRFFHLRLWYVCKSDNILRLCWDLSFKLFFYVSQGGCISKLEEFILQHLLILGSVGLGIAFIQVNNSNINSHILLIFVLFCIIIFNLWPSLFVPDCRDDFYLLPVSKFERRNILRERHFIPTNTK